MATAKKNPNAAKVTAIKQAAGEPEPYTFTHDGEQYTLPPADQGRRSLKAGALIDVLMDENDRSDVKFGLQLLMSVKPSAEALAALRDMDVETFSETLNDWMETTGAEAGKSVAS